MKIGSGAETFVVEAREIETFLEILFERVQRFELGRECGCGAAARSAPEHLISAIDQETDLIAEHQAGFVDVRMLIGPIFDDGANAVAEHLRFARSSGTGAETQFAQSFDAFAKARFVTFLSAEEHSLTIMPE